MQENHSSSDTINTDKWIWVEWSTDFSITCTTVMQHNGMKPPLYPSLASCQSNISQTYHSAYIQCIRLRVSHFYPFNHGMCEHADTLWADAGKRETIFNLP